MAEIVLKNICKKYDNELYAVKDVNLEINEKDFVILVGPSGCGKSTTLRMVAGLEEISSGELWIDGELSNYSEPSDRGMSMVFKNYALYPNMTVYGNIAFSLKIRKVPKNEIDKRVHEVAKVLEIEHLLDRRPNELSGGQKQRVAIGSAIIREPKVLLMDEPLSNLDAKLRSQMRVELAKLHHDLGATILYVTHDQTEAMTLGTKIVVMKLGIVQQIAPPKEIYDNPANLFVAGFLGSPSMNFIDAEVHMGNDDVILYFNRMTTGKKFILRDERADIAAKKAMNKSVILGVRPEDVYTYDEAKKLGFERNTVGMEVTIESREMHGAHTFLYYTIDGKQNSICVSHDDKTKVGDKINIYFDPDKIHIFDSQTEQNIFYKGEND